jgi:aryl-alcohol dehydrogenase
MSAVMAARVAGASTIIAVDPVTERRDLALELGATLALAPIQCL